jgi:predicted RNase H-like HicB family nuclease
MKTYVFKVVVEPDDDAWFASCPALESQGAATWGDTQEEALKNIEEVVRMVVESLVEHGEPLPQTSSDQVEVSYEPRVTVTV